MEYLRVLNLQFDKYHLTTNFDDDVIYGVLCDNQEIRTQFYKLLAGINKSKGEVVYKERNVFDNSEYFHQRLFLDCKNKYLKTMNSKEIKENFKTSLNKEFNEKLFKKAVENVNLRSEVKITNEYIFSDLGNTLLNFCLFKGLNYQYNIIDNPVINVSNLDLKKKIYSSICLKELNPIVTVESILEAKEYCDKLLIIKEFSDLSMIDIKNDSYLVSEDNIILRNKILRIDNKIISINTYTKEELKYLSKNKVKYKIINLNELIKLLGGNKNA